MLKNDTSLIVSTLSSASNGLHSSRERKGVRQTTESFPSPPGVYSARYAGGEGHDAQANMLKLLHELEGKENRKAQFRTAISLILDRKEYLFEGVIKGEIIKEKRGDSGFGYDPIFKPEGYDRTFAELGNDIKNQISHRALAVQKLCEFLQS